MPPARVIVIGAGMGGLAAATELAARGAEVTILERASTPGGKLRQVDVGGALIDAGPTVFTMRWVFDKLFAQAGTALEDHMKIQQADVLARHWWTDGASLDLFADEERSIDAIRALSGPGDAEGYRKFIAESRQIYEMLEGTFINNRKPSLPGLVARIASANAGNLLSVQPFTSLWKSLGRFFNDQRLRQLFARYSTYCGSSPFEAPATLMLIAHVERAGVWLVDGGMKRLAEAVAAIAVKNGCTLRLDAHVDRIGMEAGRACDVRLQNGERFQADAVICNGDINALASGAFGPAVAKSVQPVAMRHRSMSAMTWAMNVQTSDFPLTRHNVFFSNDYKAEFDDIFDRRTMPRAPTIYICAQDRGSDDAATSIDGERLFCIMNAPATGDRREFDQTEIDQCAASMRDTLSRCGLKIEPQAGATAVTTPTDFNMMFPATGGALYGRASHGSMASFQRAAARSRIAGLYFAGGSVHPGAGLPMAALSGNLAAQAVIADLASERQFRPAVMPGGMLTA